MKKNMGLIFSALILSVTISSALESQQLKERPIKRFTDLSVSTGQVFEIKLDEPIAPLYRTQVPLIKPASAITFLESKLVSKSPPNYFRVYRFKAGNTPTKAIITINLQQQNAQNTLFFTDEYHVTIRASR